MLKKPLFILCVVCLCYFHAVQAMKGTCTINDGDVSYEFSFDGPPGGELFEQAQKKARAKALQEQKEGKKPHKQKPPAWGLSESSTVDKKFAAWEKFFNFGSFGEYFENRFKDIFSKASVADKAFEKFFASLVEQPSSKFIMRSTKNGVEDFTFKYSSPSHKEQTYSFSIKLGYTEQALLDAIRTSVGVAILTQSLEFLKTKLNELVKCVQVLAG